MVKINRYQHVTRTGRIKRNPVSDVRYEGWRNWDTWEVALILRNEESLYNQILSWKKNFLLKKSRGTYSEQKALMAVKKYVVSLARKQEARYAGYASLRDFVQSYEGNKINPAKVDAKEILDMIMSEG